MTQAVVGEQLGSPEVYAIQDFDPGPLAPNTVRVAIRAAGVSYVDVLNAAGGYQVKPPVPFVPGSEAAGIVEAVGGGVSEGWIGRRVLVSSTSGGFATHNNFPEGAIRSIPEDMSFEQAAVFHISAATAYHALVQRGRLQPRDTLLVLGAGGATGSAAIQVAKLLKARVIASASSASKRALALDLGADVAIDTRSEAWREDLKAANDGRPVDVVFDPVGGSATELAFRSLAWNGRHLIIGFLGGIAKLPTNLALLKGAALIGVDIRQLGIFEPEVAAANSAAILSYAAQGKLLPAIARSYPLDQFSSAMNAVAKGETTGRVVLTP